MPRKNSDLRRRRATRALKGQLLIFSEGRKTEPTYFRYLGRAFGGKGRSIWLAPKPGTPQTLLKNAKSEKKARSRRDSGASLDEYWLVFDCDNHPYIANVFNEARDAGVQIAFSNPCIEIWFLIHFCVHNAPSSADDVARELKKHCKSYKDGMKYFDYSELDNKIDDAVKNAKILCLARQKEGHDYGNPCTTIFKLVQIIRESG